MFPVLTGPLARWWLHSHSQMTDGEGKLNNDSVLGWLRDMQRDTLHDSPWH